MFQQWAQHWGTSRVVVALATFLNITLLGGITLSVASHLHGGPAAQRFVYGIYWALVMAHFLLSTLGSGDFVTHSLLPSWPSDSRISSLRVSLIVLVWR